MNLLGQRQPDIYGATSLEDIETMCKSHTRARGYDITCFQSNHEGAMIDALHAARGVHDGVAMNAGAYTHTSIALHDAIKAIELPVVELHLSNIHAREPYRHSSAIASAALGQISGFGAQSYILALDALIYHLAQSR